MRVRVFNCHLIIVLTFLRLAPCAQQNVTKFECLVPVARKRVPEELHLPWRRHFMRERPSAFEPPEFFELLPPQLLLGIATMVFVLIAAVLVG
jgi:hypothetical protein